MDKYEYKLRLEEIKTLNRKGRFQEAAQVADTVDWKKVRNVSTLGIISDVYKVNRRFEDAKAILLLANDQSPQNRRILYSLCDLTIKMGQVVEAVEYYKEFVQMAPNDNSKYILLYKIYEAQDISLDERIAVLKEYKKREYSEKWAYELAFLYHRVGLATECVEECDQLILWFGEGKYVIKAMELKMRYMPLSPAQQQAYDRMFGRRPEQEEAPVVKAEHQTAAEPAVQEPPVKEEEQEIQVNMGQYNTMNLQAALAESMREVLEPEQQPVYDRAEAEPVQEVGRVKPAIQPAYGGDSAEYQEDLEQVMQASANWDAQATGQLAPEAEEELSAPQPEPVIRPEPAPQPGGQGEMATLLSQEYDGQISMALPEEKPAEKQITGQMNIEDVLAEWEKLKKKNEEKRKQETRQWMLQQTGSLFDDFDQLSRDGMLEKLQREEALPIEDVQRRRDEEPYELPEVEELEDVEETAQQEQSKTEPAVRPMPANAAARAVMAAQGVMEEVPIGKPQETERSTGQNAEAQLSETEKKRLAIEALMREAEAKQREAQALLQELERERQAMLQSPAMQAEPAPGPQTEAEQAAVPQAAVPTQPMGGQAAPKELRSAADGMETANRQPAGTGQPVRPAEEMQSQAPEQFRQEAHAQEAEQPRQEAYAQAAEQPRQEVNAQAAEQPRQEANAQAAEPSRQDMNAQMAEQPRQEANAQAAEQSRQDMNAQAAEQPREQEAGQPESAREAGTASGAKAGKVSGNTEALNERIREQQLEEHERNMTQEERELFAPFVPTKGAMRQLVKALDAISLSAYTGNMIITGAPGSDMIKMAKSVIKKMRASDRNFSGKLAKISGDVLNTRNVANIVAKIPNGALIIEKGGKLSDEGAANLAKALNQEQTGIIVFLLDNKRAIGSLMERCPQLAACFTARFDIAALDTATLVKYGCQYAYNMEFSIDELGRLALHTRIEDMQTRDHAVTVEEVREIVEEAIDHAERFSIRHFLDILFRRRYDEDDMIILRERDFI